MFLKIAVIALTAFSAVPAQGAEVWNGMTASWSMNPFSQKVFHTLPQTSEEAKNNGWVDISGVTDEDDVEALCYQGDPEVALLYKKNVSFGIQLAIPVSEVDPNQPIKWADLDVIIEKQLNGEDEWFYTATAYFANDKSTGTRQIWFQTKDGLVEIPTSASKLTATTAYEKKKCFMSMGTHYYTWTPDSDCATLSPWALVADGDNINGIVLQGFGKLTNRGNRQWWEDFVQGGIYGGMADPPQCAVDASNTYGVISLHIWFLKNPRIITCPLW